MEFLTSEFIWTIINFLVFITLLKVLFYKPVMEMLRKRREEIETNLENAAKSRAEAEELRKKYHEEMASARGQAQEIVTSAQKAGLEAKEKIESEARDRAAKELEKAKEAIRREKDSALAELRQEVADLAIMAAGKVIDKTLTMEEHGRLAREFVQEVGDAKC